MRLLVLSGPEVHGLLLPGACADAMREALVARAEGAVGPGHIRAEIGEVLAGSAPGRADDDEITVFESLGLAVGDLPAAALAYRKATELGAGSWVEF